MGRGKRVGRSGREECWEGVVGRSGREGQEGREEW